MVKRMFCYVSLAPQTTSLSCIHMTDTKKNKKWEATKKAIKAVQVAFDLDEKFQYSIRRLALDKGVSPSDQIRQILGLKTAHRPKRPRLTVSLSEVDYAILAEKYGLSPDDQLEIKKHAMAELTHFIEDIDS